MLNQGQIQNIEKLLKVVGDFQLQNQHQINSADIEEKSPNQLVSYVDIESEKKLVSGLLQITPNAGFLTEEKTTNMNNPNFYWIIDPIDGTTNYLFGHTKFSISIALYLNGNPIYAAVYIPPDNELFSASPQGAFLNNKPIEVSSRSHLSDTLIATGFPYYTFGRIAGYTQSLVLLMKKTKGIRRMGSAAIDLAYTACGRFDAFYELNLSPWDVAGGAYIVQQAGGLVTDFDNSTHFVFGNSILAGNPQIHREMYKLLQGVFN